MRALGGAPTRTGIDELYDAFQQPRNVREALPLLEPRRRPRLRRRGARARPRACWPAPTSAPTPPSRCCATGSCTAWWRSTSTSTPRRVLAAIQLLPAAEGHRLDAPAPPPRVVAPPAEVLVAAGPFTMGTDDPWALDNERPAHEVDVPAFWIDADARHQRAVPALRRRRWLRRRARWWSACGLGVAPGGRRSPPRSSGGATATPGFACASVTSRPCPRTSPCSTSAGTKPTPTPAGPAVACPRRRSGRRRPATTRAPASPAAGRGATLEPTERPRQPRPDATSSPPRSGAYPDGVSPVRLPPDGRRRVGVGGVGLRAPTQGSVPSRTRSTPRCSTATATRCSAAGRGPPTRASGAPPSATGTSPSAGRSSPASAPPETPDVPPPRVRRPVPLAGIRALRAGAVAREAEPPSRASSATAPSTPTGGASAGGTPTSARSRPATAPPRRCGPTTRSGRSPRWCTRVRSSRPCATPRRPRRSSTPATPRSRRARGCSR